MKQYTESTSMSQETRPTINAYLIDAGIVNVVAEDLDELGCIYEDARLIAFVYASSRGAAKSLFIQHWSDDLEWLSPMSIRLLATDIHMSPEVDDGCGYSQIEDGWTPEHLTKFGREYWTKIETEIREYQKFEDEWDAQFAANGGQS